MISTIKINNYGINKVCSIIANSINQVITIVGMILSSYVTYLLTKHKFKREYTLNRLGYLKEWVSKLSIIGIKHCPEYYEIRLLLNKTQKTDVDKIFHEIDRISKEENEKHADAIETAKKSSSPKQSVIAMGNEINKIIVMECLELEVRLKEIFVSAIVEKEKQSMN